MIAAQAAAGSLAPRPRPRRPADDPVSELIALSTSHFEAGQRELREGHLEMAKAEFNRSLEVLLESRFGGRTVPRIREHFDRLVERISAYEMTALAQGDGFTEKKYESATIDDLLDHLHVRAAAGNARKRKRPSPPICRRLLTTSTSRCTPRFSSTSSCSPAV